MDCLVPILNFWRTGADPRTAGRERTLEPQDGSGPKNRRMGADPITAGRERTLAPHGRARTQGPHFFEGPVYFLSLFC